LICSCGCVCASDRENEDAKRRKAAASFMDGIGLGKWLYRLPCYQRRGYAGSSEWNSIHTKGLPVGRPFAVRFNYGLHAEVFDVDVSAETNVIGEIPSWVIRIFVDDHIVAIPVPAITEGDIVRGYAEIEAVEPEAAGSAAAETPVMRGAEAARKVTMLPRVIEVIVRIIATCVMANPVIAFVHVRGIGMPWMILEVAMLFWRVGCAVKGRRAVCGWGCWMRRMPLRQDRQAENKSGSQNSCICFHGIPPYRATAQGPLPAFYGLRLVLAHPLSDKLEHGLAR